MLDTKKMICDFGWMETCIECHAAKFNITVKIIHIWNWNRKKEESQTKSRGQAELTLHITGCKSEM